MIDGLFVGPRSYPVSRPPNPLLRIIAYATVGEICDVFREVFGVYTETSVL